MTRICLFGGSFDPTHLGHLAMARAARDAGAQDRIVVLPAHAPPHKRGGLQAPAEERLAMARLAFSGLEGVEVSALEIRRGGLSYTVETVRWHRARLAPGDELAWLMGSDSVPDLPSWREPHELLRLCRILIVPRRGFPPELLAGLAEHLSEAEIESLRRGFLAVEPVDVSSTEVRARLARGEEPAGLVPPAVAAWIARRGLYRRAPR